MFSIWRYAAKGSALAILFAGTAAQAQENSAGAEKKVERIEVTGSHIKRIDVEGPAPIVILDKDYLEKSGATSVGDVLRNSTSSSFGSFKESTGNTWAGQSHANLRGLGSTRTLVLLDGKRLPSDAASGSVDLNMIPMAAVDRIEILKDGASATYGSDALGGVINIITKKDFAGAEATVKYYSPTQKGGGKQEYSIVGGTATADTSLTTVLYFQKREPIWSRDREWSKEGLSPLGSPGSYRTTGVDANGDKQVGEWRADPNCPAALLVTDASGTRCQYVHANDSSIYPEVEQLSSLTNFEHRFGKRFSLFSRFGASRQLASWEFAPAPGIFPIPASAAGTLGPDGGPLPGVEPGSDIEAAYRLVELGNRRSEIETTSFNILGGFRGQIFDFWDFEISTSVNRISRLDLSVSGYAIEGTLRDQVAEGKFNPFGEEGSRGSLDEAFYQPWQKSTATQRISEAKISGELFDLPGGPVGMAVGAQSAREEYTDKIDNLSVQGQVFSSAGSSGGGSRDINSAYMEFGLPVASNVEVQLAARHDQYSDFGSTTNPKAAVRVQAHETLLLRSSYGTGFKAPSLVDVHAADSFGYPFIVDARVCNAEKAASPGGELPASCREKQYLVKSGGNSNLEEERSKSFNVGFLFQPAQYVSIGLDYWRVDITNQVGIDYNDLMKAEAKGVDVSQHGVEITRDSKGNIERIDAPIQNLSQQELAGYDLALEASFGNFGVRNDYTRLSYFREEGFPGAGFTDKLGQRSRPAWRNTMQLTYAIAAFESALIARTIAGQEKDVKEEGNLPNYTEWDLSLGYATPWQGKLLAGGSNIFAAKPPLDDSNPGQPLEAQLYDQIGQTFYVGYKQLF